MAEQNTNKKRYISKKLRGKDLEFTFWGNIYKKNDSSNWFINTFMLEKVVIEKDKANDQNLTNDEVDTEAFIEEINKIAFNFNGIYDIRFGQIYSDGITKLSSIKNRNDILLPYVNSWKTGKVKKYLRYLPYFHRQKEIYNQNLFIFEVEEKTYYLPQIELARVLFLSKSLIARYALIPNGLSLLGCISEEYSEVERKQEKVLMLNSAFPVSYLEDESIVNLLLWLFTNQSLMDSFASIYFNMLDQNNNKESSWSGFIFAFDPPSILDGVMINASYEEKKLKEEKQGIFLLKRFSDFINCLIILQK